MSEHQPRSEQEELEGEEFTTAEDKLLALFRRIATPFKRVNKVNKKIYCVIIDRKLKT